MFCDNALNSLSNDWELKSPHLSGIVFSRLGLENLMLCALKMVLGTIINLGLKLADCRPNDVWALELSEFKPKRAGRKFLRLQRACCQKSPLMHCR